ncbi:hypothetical protein RND71_035741 [Anisodus tanguticus]|uniref:Uncharacterized protein n=1 Tax=Anisodus tanguticus TaxID=243964 RepID=A0AAE1V2G3_9SOLA|nr:hypothetical protein RND71_035741 [Anisodus tanguticus]
MQSSSHRRAQYSPEAHTALARKWTHRIVSEDETRDVLAICRDALGHQESYRLAYNISQDPTASNAEKDAAETQVAVAQRRSKRERRATRCGTEEIPDVIVEDPDAMEKDMMSNTCPPEDLQQQKQQLKGGNNKVEYNQLKENVMNSMSNNCIPRSNSVHNQCSPNKVLLEIVTHQVASQELEESKKDLQQYEDEESSIEPLKQAAKEVDMSPRATTKWGKKGKQRVSTTKEDFIKEDVVKSWFQLSSSLSVTFFDSSYFAKSILPVVLDFSSSDIFPCETVIYMDGYI